MGEPLARDSEPALLITAVALDQAYAMLNELVEELSLPGDLAPSPRTINRARALLPPVHSMSRATPAHASLLPYQRRVIAEWASCEKRLRALEVFMLSEPYAGLSRVEAGLMSDQKVAMQDYAHALAERLRLWGLDVEALREEMLGG